MRRSVEVDCFIASRSPQVRVALHQMRNALQMGSHREPRQRSRAQTCAGSSSATHSDVVRHREQVEGAQRRAAGSRARRRWRGRGRGRRGRRRRTRRPAGARSTICSHHLAAGALARRVEDDEVERLVVRRRAGPGRPGRARRGRADGRLAAGVAGRRRAVALDRHHPPGRPDGVGEERREEPDAGVEVEHPLPRLRLAAARAPSRPAPAGASTCDCQKPSAATANSCGAVRRLDGLAGRRLARPRARRRASIRQSSIATTSCGAVHVQPAAAVGQGDVAHPGAPAQASAGTASTTTSSVEPGQPRQLLADHGRLEARAAPAGSTCWKSQPPHSARARRTGTGPRPGPATRSSTSTASPRQKRSPSVPSVTSTTTRSPGRACRTKTTRSRRASVDRATQWPPWATGPTSTS